ncbi:VENN motif pre-toxin domain-containing protein [Phytobacter ursingii]
MLGYLCEYKSCQLSTGFFCPAFFTSRQASVARIRYLHRIRESWDTTGAHTALENNFEKGKIQDQLDIQTQAMDAWRQSQLDEGKKKIRADMEANGELDGLTEQQIDDKIAGSAQYKEVDKEYGVGSDFWRNGTALTGLLAGALGGNVTGGMAAGAAPYVAGLIKSVAGGHESARIALHTLASAVLVQLQGGNAAAGAAGGFIASSGSEALSLAFYNKKPDKLSPDEKTVIVNLVAALGAAGGSVAAGNSSGANAARVEVENNFLGPESREKLDKAVENQQAGKDLLNASKEIVRQNNVDRHSDELLHKLQTDPQSMTESERQQLAAYLNVYAYELQASNGLSPEKARQLVNSLISGEPALKPSPGYPGGGGDASSYYEALSYLKMYSVQSSQAAMGTDALLALPGGVGTAARATLAAGGAYQTGTGIGQIIDGQYGEGALNVGLGSVAIFGSVAGQSVIKKTDTGVFSPETIIGLQESSRSTGKNIFPESMFKISPENQKYVDILSPEAK